MAQEKKKDFWRYYWSPFTRACFSFWNFQYCSQCIHSLFGSGQCGLNTLVNYNCKNPEVYTALAKFLCQVHRVSIGWRLREKKSNIVRGIPGSGEVYGISKSYHEVRGSMMTLLYGDTQVAGWAAENLLILRCFFFFLKFNVWISPKYSSLKHSFSNLNMGCRASQGQLTFWDTAEP